mmetsp:Transcript_27216/g.41397  ORF Transcript_27216/g.41397 Transcript_27216/m.41397 type:complete len:330 (+) Transcript_27216:166-1155(+)
MARGKEAKARRKDQRKEANKVVSEMMEHDFGLPQEEEEELPTPPPQSNDHGDTDVTDDDDELILPPPRKDAKSKKAKKVQEKMGGKSKEKATKYTNRAMKAANASSGSSKGIKTTPLILLVIMTGTTLIPGLIYASDFLGGYFAKNNVLGSIGYRLGVGQTPKKRVMSFYEKHDPDKIEEVPKIMAKYYGDYPKLLKRLERKYQDYGYFLEWEQDEAPMTLAFEQLAETRDYLGTQFQTYAPQPVKTAVRNVQYNVGKLKKKGRKIFKKKVWPLLEPIFGVPEGAAAQKRKDAKAARDRKNKASGTGRRRKNTEFRDDVEDESTGHDEH